ncbi:MAG: RHS repeat protein, partial [bacterium]|nr:RHS repeat protein [bacterium]
GYYRLKEFNPPVLPPVSYEYESGSSPDVKLTAVNTSYGGRMEYQYEDHTFYYKHINLYTDVVKQKKIRFNSSGAFKNWIYTYPSYQNVDTGTVNVNGPEYDTDVTYHAYSTATPWKIGLLKEKRLTDDSFSQETQWQPFRISGDNWIILNVNMGDIQATLPSKTITTRKGDATSVEEYLYERSSVEKYGLPTRINYYGGASGTSLKSYKTFQYYFESNGTFASNYMLDPVKTETVYSNGGSKLKETQTAYYTSSGKLGAIDWIKRWRNGSGYFTWDYTYSSTNPNSITITINPPGAARVITNKYSYGVLSELKRYGYTELTRSISSYNSAILSETNRHGGTMGFTYDNLDRIKIIDMPVGFNDITADWSTDIRSVTINQGENTVVKYWDGMGRDLGYEETGSETGITLYYRKTLDDEGRVLTENKGSTSLNDKYTYVLNDAGNITKITDPRGKITNMSYSGTTKIVTDAENHTNTFYFEGLPGKFTKLKDPNNKYANYTYDGIGRLTQVIYNNARTQAYAYNGLDQVTSETHPETGAITYIYNNENNLYRKQWDNTVMEYSYNNDNQLKTLDSGDEDITYTYDSNGRLLEVVSTAGWNRKQIYYNTLGSVTHEQQYIPGLGLKGMTYGYDNNNNLDSITYPDGRVLSISNNDLNMPESAGFNSQALVSEILYGIRKQPTYMTVTGNGT